ncbi:YppE family protein [Peribacillus muralis]|uniref:YppE family protein n=1 Tax=Peribacillus muralis TaxID=264697 RepID=UPI001F4E5FA6|nr:YppE family protein [Peribacillus muralis]MCK2011825.1 YppE family protein [Peribacillus muralis]
MQKEKLQRLTDQLIKYTSEADDIYEGVREAGKEKDFFSEVKPFADQVKEACVQWESGMKEWMKETEFKHLFPEQIEQTAHNLSDVAVQAFFPKTSYKRFKSHVQSVEFILHHVKAEIERILS